MRITAALLLGSSVVAGVTGMAVPEVDPSATGASSSTVVAAGDLSHEDVLWLARNNWGIHESVIQAMEGQAFTLQDLDCGFLDALMQDPFRYMAFKKFCDKATEAATQKFTKVVSAEGGELVSVSVAVPPQETARRRLAASSGTSGIKIARDNSSVELGVESDVRLYRGATAFLGIDAVEVLVEKDLHVGGILTVDGAMVDPVGMMAKLTSLNDTLSSAALASPTVVKKLPDDCAGRVWVENIGLYECVGGFWARTYDAACDPNRHTEESYVLYNGGAELGVDSTSGYANGWEEYCCGSYDATDASQGEVTTDWALCGRHSFHWKSTLPSTRWDLIEQTKDFRFEMLAGCTYAASFWAYCTDLNSDPELGGHFRTEFLRYDASATYKETLNTAEDSVNGFRAYHLFPESLQGSWVYFEHDGITPAEDTLGVGMNFGMVQGWSGECFVDHIQIYSTDCQVEPNYVCGFAEDSVDHPDQNNMIFNGGFEILEENDHVTVAEGDYAAGFARYGSYGSTGLLSDDMARCGTYSLKFTTTDASESWDLVENDEEHPIRLVEGCEYLLEFCAINTDGSGDIRTELLKRQGGSQTAVATTDESDAVYYKYHSFSGEDLWECFSHNFTPSANQSAFLNFGMRDGWTGTFFIDNVHLHSTTCDNLSPEWRNCTDEAGNIFPNGHFETNTVGSFPSDDFSVYLAEDGTSITVSDDRAFCGSNSLKYSSSSQVGWDLLMNDECISLASGETYLMTFWWYAASASEGETGSILPQTVRSEFLYYTNSADTVYDGVMPTVTGSESTYVKYHSRSDGHEWGYAEHRLTPSGDYSCIKINFGMKQGWQGTFYFDQLQLVCETC